MVKIKWLITDNLLDVNIKQLNANGESIYGYFEIQINKHIVGFCPNRKLLAGEEGNEDILYWLSKLSDGIIKLHDTPEYEIELFSMNLAKVVLKKNNKFLFCFVNSDTNEVIWFEELIREEMYNEIVANIERLVSEIQQVNSVLMQMKSLKELVEIKDIIKCEYLHKH